MDLELDLEAEVEQVEAAEVAMVAVWAQVLIWQDAVGDNDLL
jgi:hypothetical protein